MNRARFLLCLAVALAGCQGGMLSRAVPDPAPAPATPGAASPTRIEYFQISDG